VRRLSPPRGYNLLVSETSEGPERGPRQGRDREPDQGPEQSGWASGMGTLGEYSVVGFVFPVALVLGFLVGRWVGDWLGGPTVGAAVGVLLGTAAGFYNLWQTVQRLERRGRERARMTGAGPAGDEERLADLAALRRIEWLAVGWTVLAATLFVVFGRATGALVLTGVSAVSIVAFRGLQRIVTALGPADPNQGEVQQKHRTIGWRQGLAVLVRLCLLGALLVAGAFHLGQRFFPALILGFSTLPAALMTEGLLQLVRALRGRDHDGIS